jgi:hypothetical protein
MEEIKLSTNVENSIKQGLMQIQQIDAQMQGLISAFLEGKEQEPRLWQLDVKEMKLIKKKEESHG